MIVLHPNSVCDVCLEGYGASNAPYAIACGHIFCLRCLRSLNKQSCPLCRTGFHNQDVRKLHVDDSSRSMSPSSSSSSSSSRPSSPREEYSTPARDFQARITRIVLDGASSSAEVRDFVEEARVWLNSQSPEKHADLRAAWFLLFKYSNVQYKFKDSKEIITVLEQDIEDLKEKMRSERESADARYQELSQKRVSEMETAMAVERSLRDHFDQMNEEWRTKYETCAAECRRLQDDLRRLKHKPLATMPRPTEPRHTPISDRSVEPMAMVEDKDSDDSPDVESEPFVLSPIPPSATLPISNRPNRQIFRPLTAEESDVEDLKSRKTSPYLLRSIDAINIRPSMHRMNSNTSLLSRHEADTAAPRSIPRSSVDVQMASCSSSPNTSQFASRERDDPMDSTPSATLRGSSRPRRLSDERNKSSLSSESNPFDEEMQHERWRAQLHNILETPQMNSLEKLRSPEPRPRAMPRQSSPDSSAPVTRTTSPTSSTTSSGPAQPSYPSQTLQNSSLLRPPLSRASTAAMQAERERARTMSHKESSSISTAPAPMPSNFSQGLPPPPPPPMSNLYPRRPSISNTTRGKPIPVNQPSGLTRTMWAMQDPQRAS